MVNWDTNPWIGLLLVSALVSVSSVNLGAGDMWGGLEIHTCSGAGAAPQKTQKWKSKYYELYIAVTIFTYVNVRMGMHVTNIHKFSHPQLKGLPRYIKTLNEKSDQPHTIFCSSSRVERLVLFQAPITPAENYIHCILVDLLHTPSKIVSKCTKTFTALPWERKCLKGHTCENQVSGNLHPLLSISLNEHTELFFSKQQPT